MREHGRAISIALLLVGSGGAAVADRSRRVERRGGCSRPEVFRRYSHLMI